MGLRILLEQRALTLPTFENATRAWSERTSLRLELHTPAGEYLGSGEAAPLPGYSPDSLEDARTALERLDPVAVAEAVAELREASLPELLLRLRTCSSGLPASAAFALESALLEAVGRQRGLAPACVLGADEANPARPAACRGYTLADALGRARSLDGCIKLKIGRDLELELRQLRQLRAAARPGLELRLDANGCLSPADVDGILGELAHVGVAYVEEPCPLASLGSARRLPVPIAFDESLQPRVRDGGALAAWLGAGSVAALVLKPMTLGGIATTFELAAFARAHGTSVVLSHCFDGSIAMATYLQLDLVLGSRGVAPGLGEHAALALWAEHTPPPFSVRGPDRGGA